LCKCLSLLQSWIQTLIVFLPLQPPSVVVVVFKWGFRYVRFNLCPFSFYNLLVRPLERIRSFVWFISTICNYFSTVVVCFGSIVGELTPFSIIGSSAPSSFRIRSEKDFPCNHFLIIFFKKKKIMGGKVTIWTIQTAFLFLGGLFGTYS
jgi:hypothetical protein